MNGYARWVMIIIVIIGIMFAAGYNMRINTINSTRNAKDFSEFKTDFKKIEVATRLVKLEEQFKNIDKKLDIIIGIKK